MYQFKEAKAVWLGAPQEQRNQFAGFYKQLHVPENTSLTIALAARS